VCGGLDGAALGFGDPEAQRDGFGQFFVTQRARKIEGFEDTSIGIGYTGKN
jgi:hypothetical protein